jgi:glyceraldehyde-3-phosphate dehydrogenase (NAD(P))
MAVKVPETMAHRHYWSVQMTRTAGKDEVLDAFRRSSRIALIRMDDGLVALSRVKALMTDLSALTTTCTRWRCGPTCSRSAATSCSTPTWSTTQAIVIPETIDAIRALSGIVEDANESITKTNAALALATALI